MRRDYRFDLKQKSPRCTYRVERENENRCNGLDVPSSKPNSFYCRIVFLLLSFIFHSMRIRASIMVCVVLLSKPLR